jgi:hypothetical protein
MIKLSILIHLSLSVIKLPIKKFNEDTHQRMTLSSC